MILMIDKNDRNEFDIDDRIRNGFDKNYDLMK